MSAAALLRFALASLLPLCALAFLTSKILGNDVSAATRLSSHASRACSAARRRRRRPQRPRIRARRRMDTTWVTDLGPARKRLQAAGWETDDDGNVYVGDDNSKLFLVQV